MSLGGHWRVGLVTALATLASSLCLAPLLDGGWWLPRTAVAVAVVAATGALTRSLRVPLPAQPAIQALALAGALTALFAGDEATWGFLPGPAALDRLQELLVQGRDFAMATKAPAGPDEGLLLIVVAGVGLASLCADSLAAGLDLPGLALVPLAALHVVPWAVARGEAPTWTFLLVAVGWLAVLASTQRDRASSWGPRARPGSPSGALLVTGTTVGGALLAGGLAAQHGPLGGLDFGAGSSGGPVRVDALVSLQRSLVDNDTRVVITYDTDAAQPDYLRLAVLEEFTGVQWRPARSGPRVDSPGGWPPDGVRAPQDALVEYVLDVGPLAGATVPSPAGTMRSRNDWPVAWDSRTSLPIRDDGRPIADTQVDLVVLPPESDAEALRRASTVPIPADRQDVIDNLDDPAGLTGPDLPRLAARIASDADTPFDTAVALQRWFRSEGGFTYSTEIPGGSGQDALADFLADRVGYCEQFAATMALMARAEGIPARVVVGFTQGQVERGRWVVRGTDAHAWPELWMGSAGWIRFEPTPGTATASAPAYSRPDATEAPADDPAEQELPAEPDAEAETPAAVAEEDGGVAAGGAGQPLPRPWWWVVVAAAASLLLVPGVVRATRRHRRLAAGGPEQAYREVVDTMADFGVRAEAATPRTTVRGLADRLDGDPAAAAALGEILAAVESSRYGAQRASTGGGLGGQARLVLRSLGAGSGRWTRIRARTFPRSLARRR